MRRSNVVMGGILVGLALLGASPRTLEAQKRQRDVIKHDEIVGAVTKEVDLHTAIQRLRPHFFENRARSFGAGTINPIRVYIDRNEQAVETLKSTLAWDVEEVRYLSPSEAEGRYGGKANGGAIVIKYLKIKEQKTDTLSTPTR
jgi:hypothetical protein